MFVGIGIDLVNNNLLYFVIIYIYLMLKHFGYKKILHVYITACN